MGGGFSCNLGRECNSESCSESGLEFRELLREWLLHSGCVFFFLVEDFAGAEKLGLASKVLQNLWGSAEPFFNRLFTM